MPIVGRPTRVARATVNEGAGGGLNLSFGHLAEVWDWGSLARTARFDSQELAGLCQVSQRTLRRFFRERFGRIPQQWLNEQRLRDAPDLLLTVKHVKAAAY